MKIVKNIIVLFCIVLLTGCAKEDSTSEWIPKETEQTKEVLPIESENEETEYVEELVNYKLSDTLKSEEGMYCAVSELNAIAGNEENAVAENEYFQRNTFYIDNNGLLCIHEKVSFDFSKEQCVLLKTYYLTDKTIFAEEEIYEISGKWKNETNKLYLEVSLLAEMFSWNYHVAENNEVAISDNRITLEKNSSEVYEPIVVRTQIGKCWSLAGTQIDAVFAGEDYRGKYSCTGIDDYVEVTEGEKLRFHYYCSWLPDVASILFLDNENNVIQVYAYTKSNTLTNYIITVPKGATKMHLSFYNNQEYKMERVRYVEGKDLTQLDVAWYEEECQKKLVENQQRSWENSVEKSYEKAYVTFVLDDCIWDMDLVADLFEEYNVPLCIAAIHENLYNPTSKREESRLQVCERVVKNGGEILAHNREPLTETLLDDFEAKYEHFYKDKKYLEMYGFDVNGIILAGGKGQVAGSGKSDMWVRMNFDYSDLYGVEEQGDPYYHRRLELKLCKDNYQELMEDAIENKKWLSFYFHGLDEVEEEKLREILEYVSGISKDKLEVVNYKTVCQ